MGESAALQQGLLRYLELLSKWNRIYNLSAIRDPASMLTHHLLDSLAVMPVLVRATAPGAVRLMDVGSGAGLPGIPLALAWPELVVDLVEPVGKKAAFLRQCALELGLAERLTVHGEGVARVAPLAPEHIVCRAFASLRDFVIAIELQATVQTRVWAMKGRYPDKELAALPAPWRMVGAHSIVVPGLNAQRHLIELSRTTCQPAEQ
jgi:16S rRNA (guanine527-N7)-methyltransferase